MNTLFIIMAAGEGKRWGNHTGVPKYLLEIDGETLVERTMRLLMENGEEDVRVVTNHPKLLENEWAYPGRNDTGKEIDRFLNCLPLVRGWEQICFLYGDVYYTEQAMKTIVSHPAHTGRFKGFKAFGRCTPFKQYGKSWGGGELFALKIRDISLFANALTKVNKHDFRNFGTGWLVYRALEGIPQEQHRIGPEFVNIDDFTNDFDSPRDYRQWKNLWEHHKKKTKQ